MKEVLILSSASDPASSNIAQGLIELGDWVEHECYRSYKNFHLAVLDGRLTSLANLDEKVRDLGVSPDLAVFVSRHVAKKDVAWLGGHFTGILDERAISTAAPSALKSFLMNLRRYAPEGFYISAEATHHGPGDTEIPSFFAEIGSSESQWNDRDAGIAVAKAVLGLEDLEAPIFLGFGGGHYVPRQTRLLMDSGIAFGHLFSNYQVDALDLQLLELACQRSGAKHAYLDRKSLRSVQKKMLAQILEELDLPVLREREITARFPELSDVEVHAKEDQG